ncbi:MAG: hypothetical protein J6X18_17000 [Bacteroidales bacterium]|nr:hypothetical protein [Bacteroidales bacterium]
MLTFRKITNWIILISGIIIGILVPISGLTAGSFVAVGVGLIIIAGVVYGFIYEQEKIKKEEQKNKQKQILND